MFQFLIKVHNLFPKLALEKKKRISLGLALAGWPHHGRPNPPISHWPTHHQQRKCQRPGTGGVVNQLNHVRRDIHHRRRPITIYRAHEEPQDWHQPPLSSLRRHPPASQMGHGRPARHQHTSIKADAEALSPSHHSSSKLEAPPSCSFLPPFLSNLCLISP